MKPIIYAILGKSGSGKNSLKKELERFDLESIKECTTRDPRPGEENGAEYVFMSEQEFKDGNVIAKTRFKTEKGFLYFGIVEQELENNKAYCLITNPAECTELIKFYKNKVIVIPLYLETDEEQRILHIIRREEEKEEPDYQEICRRIKGDYKDFSEKNDIFYKIRKNAILIHNSFQIPISDIAEEVYATYIKNN